MIYSLTDSHGLHKIDDRFLKRKSHEWPHADDPSSTTDIMAIMFVSNYIKQAYNS